MTFIEYIGGPMDGAKEQMPDEIEYVIVKQPMIRVMPGGNSETRMLLHRYDFAGVVKDWVRQLVHKSITMEDAP